MKYMRTGPGSGSGRLGAGTKAAASMLLAVSLAFGAGAAALPASAAPADAEATAAWSEQEQQVIDVFNGINDFRKTKDLPALRIGMNASEVAQEWSVHMAKTGMLVHSTSHAQDMRIADWWSASENIANTYVRSGKQLVKMWIDSPGHNDNMSRPGDNVIGVGVASDTKGNIWGTTTYYRYAPVVSKTYATAEEYLRAIAVPAVPGAVPVVLGTPAYQQQLSVKPAAWPAGTSLSYQWWAGTQRLQGETGPTLNVPSVATRKKISVEVTAKAPGYRETAFFSAQTEIVPAAEKVQYTNPPKINGTPAWGETLTLDPGSWEPGATLAFEWSTGETGRTHVIQPGETRAAVHVTATKPGRYDTRYEATLEIPVPKLTYSVKPSIKGLPAVGQSLGADPGVWNVEPSMRYTWLRNGVEIPGAANYSSYTLTEEDLGAVITFSAAASADNYEDRTVVSDATAKIGPRLWSKNLTKPTITGNPVVGNPLETNGGTWEKDVLGVDYQWLRDGKPIAGERSNVYHLTAADAGKKISVQGIGIHANSGHGRTVATSDAVTVKLAPKPTPPPRKKFKDVPDGMQFAKEINWMNDKGISTGWADNTYRPQNLVARDAMSAFMYRLADSPSFNAPAASPYRDVVNNQQFYKEMSWLAATKVSTGWSDGTYRPLKSVNRDAMAAFMYRLAGSPKFTPPVKSPFTDVATGDEFYKEISWLASTGISTGWDQGNGKKAYQPLAPVKRDAMAAFMYRFDQKGYALPSAK